VQRIAQIDGPTEDWVRLLSWTIEKKAEVLRVVIEAKEDVGWRDESTSTGRSSGLNRPKIGCSHSLMLRSVPQPKRGINEGDQDA